MKPLIYKSFLWISMLAISSITLAQNATKKEYHKSYNAKQVNKLLLESKFGNATIKDNGSNTVTVDVVVEVQDKSGETAQKILDKIKIEIELSGSGVLMVETNIDSNGMPKGSFSINYDINIPKDKDIIAESKYGNLYIEELTGSGVFEVSYGNITGRKLLSKDKIVLELSYGNGVFDDLNNAVMEVKYSNLSIKNHANNIVLEGKNSKYDINTLGSLTMESKYDDLRIKEVSQMVIEMGYTNVKLEKLLNTFVAETNYGNVNVNYIQPEFSKIAIESNYGDIQLGIDANATYKIDMESRYGEINVPQSDRVNSETDNHDKHVYGIVGNGEPKGTLVTSSNYGSVNIKAK